MRKKDEEDKFDIDQSAPGLEYAQARKQDQELDVAEYKRARADAKAEKDERSRRNKEYLSTVHENSRPGSENSRSGSENSRHGCPQQENSYLYDKFHKSGQRIAMDSEFNPRQ